MKTLKPFLAALAVTLCVANISYADTRLDVLPNQIPHTIQFKPGNTSVTLSFPNSTLPAKFLCYFAANSDQFKGINAHISTTNNENTIEFMPGTDDSMEAGKSDVKMFTVSSTAGNANTGSITIALDGNMSVLKAKMITMICTMRK